MNISLCKISNRWQLHNTKESKKGIHSVHKGHFQISSEHIHTNIKLMPKNEIELAKQCSQLNLTNSTTASLVSIQNALGVGNTWTRHQIYYKSKIDNGMHNLTKHASSAEKLIQSFDNRNDVNYLYLTFKPSEGLMLMTGKLNNKNEFYHFKTTKIIFFLHNITASYAIFHMKVNMSKKE